jgi:hypothetical protein
MSLFGMDSFTYNNLAAKISGKKIVVKNSFSADGFDMDRAVEMANIVNTNNPEQEEEVVDEQDSKLEEDNSLDDMADMEIDSSIRDDDLSIGNSKIENMNLTPSSLDDGNSNEKDPIEQDPQQTEINVDAIAKIKEKMNDVSGLGLIKDRLDKDLDKIVNPVGDSKVVSTTNFDEQDKIECESKVKAGSKFSYSNYPTNMGLTNNWACREFPDDSEPSETSEPSEPTETQTGTSKPASTPRRSGGGGGGKGNYMKDLDKLWKKRLKKGKVKTETGPSQAQIDMEENPIMTVLKYGIGSIVLIGGSYFAIKNEYPQKIYKGLTKQ